MRGGADEAVEGPLASRQLLASPLGLVGARTGCLLRASSGDPKCLAQRHPRNRGVVGFAECGRPAIHGPRDLLAGLIDGLIGGYGLLDQVFFAAHDGQANTCIAK